MKITVEDIINDLTNEKWEDQEREGYIIDAVWTRAKWNKNKIVIALPNGQRFYVSIMELTADG